MSKVRRYTDIWCGHCPPSPIFLSIYFRAFRYFTIQSYVIVNKKGQTIWWHTAWDLWGSPIFTFLEFQAGLCLNISHPVSKPTHGTHHSCVEQPTHLLVSCHTFPKVWLMLWLLKSVEWHEQFNLWLVNLRKWKLSLRSVFASQLSGWDSILLWRDAKSWFQWISLFLTFAIYIWIIQRPHKFSIYIWIIQRSHKDGSQNQMIPRSEGSIEGSWWRQNW